MASETKKNIVLHVDQEFHKKLKIYAAVHNTTMHDYIIGLIKADMEKENKSE